MSEHDQLRRAQQGDPEAIETLWLAHRRWLATCVIAHGLGGEDIEDVMQEVALSLCRKIGSLREPAALRSWLRQIAINVARTAHRRSERRPTTDILADDEVLAAPPSVASRARDEARERLNLTLAAAESLPIQYREPLMLKVGAGLSLTQISDTLDVPVSTLESRLARARRMLREALSKKHSIQKTLAPRWGTGTP